MTVTVWILGDQLLQSHPALEMVEEQFGRDQTTVLMIESGSRMRRLPYQRKKLVLLISAMRHYADKLRSLGYKVDYQQTHDTSTAIRQHLQDHKPGRIISMAASEYRGRMYQEKLSETFDIPVTIPPNTQFLIGRYDPIPEPEPNMRVMQEQFYRKMRRHFDLLMEPNGEPVGGKWNFDKSNRRSLPRDNQPPPPISFEPDVVTQVVMSEVDRKFTGVGQVDGFELSVTNEQAQQAATDFFDHRLANFGAYEDAMSTIFDTIYHSQLSPYLNLGLLDPLDLAIEAQKRYVDGQVPINSVEGFIRQVVGWREYIYWQYWRLMPGILNSNYWQADRPLPAFFWDGETDLNCLKNVVDRALRNGYTHHIERLMVISNFCLLAGFNPLVVNDWFLSTYVDAYEWVMVPNVFGMGLYADGGLVGTKPYIGSANYINKMSDYCQNCKYERKQRTGEEACPYNYLYWNFILQHEPSLRSNPRMARNLFGLRHLDQDQRRSVKEDARQFLDRL